jgi:capsular exopolysaccharide synthesis family protein
MNQLKALLADPRRPAGGGSPDRIDLAGLWRSLVKHAGVIALGVAFGLAIGAAVTLLSRPVYKARATLQIDREAEKVVGPGEQTPLDNLGEEFFQTQYGLLRSRALAERVAESLGLTRDDGFIDAMAGRSGNPRPTALTADERRSRVITLLRTHEGVAPERGSRLVSVTFRSPDPALSAKVANAFAENFIASALERRFESSSYARDFLQKRLAEVKARLEESERDVVAYAARQQIIQLPNAGPVSVPDAGPSLAAANLASFNTALAAARTERIKAEQGWRQAQATNGGAAPEILRSPTFQILSQEHAKLVSEYEDKLRIFKPDYPDMVRLKARIDETARQLNLEAENVRQSLRSQYQAALANEQALSGEVDGLKTAVLDLRGRSIRYAILQREVDTNRALYDGLLQRFKEVGVAGGVASNNISIVDRAEPPVRPSEPRPLIIMGLAGLAGVILGIALALARESFDQTLRTPADMETEIGLPLLGAIPTLRRRLEPRDALADTRSHISEAYQSLGSALRFSTVDGFPKTLMITSPWPGAGKTTTALAIARYIGRLGLRVLLVDGDLRHPSIADLAEVRSGAGLTSLLIGAATLEEVVQTTAFPNLFVVTAGPRAPNPAELLAGPRLQSLVAEGSAHFDVVVFDAPPVMGLADAPIIGSMVTGCLLVVEASVTSQTQALQALRRMSLAGARVLGTILTKYKAADAGYGYGTLYPYGAVDSDPMPPGGSGGMGGMVARARQLVSR